MSERRVEIFLDGNTDEIRFYADGASDGAACVNVPLADALEWALAFMRFVGRHTDFNYSDYYGDEPEMLPGRFGVLNEVDPDEDATSSPQPAAPCATCGGTRVAPFKGSGYMNAPTTAQECPDCAPTDLQARLDAALEKMPKGRCERCGGVAAQPAPAPSDSREWCSCENFSAAQPRTGEGKDGQ